MNIKFENKKTPKTHEKLPWIFLSVYLNLNKRMNSFSSVKDTTLKRFNFICLQNEFGI